MSATMTTLSQVLDRKPDGACGTLGTRQRAGHEARRLKVLADRAADEVLRLGQPIALPAMSDKDREIVREYLRWRKDLVASSQGEGPERHITIIPI